jgi:hypothetical protein
MESAQCPCYKTPFKHIGFKTTVIGIDKTDGRFADVTCDECLNCGCLWLHYFYKIEAFGNSGRWYRGLINLQQLSKINPENSINHLKSLDWHYAGGSYFKSTGIKRNHQINGFF